MCNNDSTIMKILTFDDSTGNEKLDSQLDDTATILFERGKTYVTPEDITEALQKNIYGDD